MRSSWCSGRRGPAWCGRRRRGSPRVTAPEVPAGAKPGDDEHEEPDQDPEEDEHEGEEQEEAAGEGRPPSVTEQHGAHRSDPFVGSVVPAGRLVTV